MRVRQRDAWFKTLIGVTMGLKARKSQISELERRECSAEGGLQCTLHLRGPQKIGGQISDIFRTPYFTVFDVQDVRNIVYDNFCVLQNFFRKFPHCEGCFEVLRGAASWNLVCCNRDPFQASRLIVTRTRVPEDPPKVARGEERVGEKTKFYAITPVAELWPSSSPPPPRQSPPKSHKWNPTPPKIAQAGGLSVETLQKPEYPGISAPIPISGFGVPFSAIWG